MDAVPALWGAGLYIKLEHASTQLANLPKQHTTEGEKIGRSLHLNRGQASVTHCSGNLECLEAAAENESRKIIKCTTVIN